MKIEKQRNSRLKKKIKSLQDIIKNLRDSNLISSSCAEALDRTIDGIPQELVSRLLNKQKGQPSNAKYSEELKAFAVTLHFYSHKAYTYARKSLCLALPHPNYLRRLYSSLDGDPGFNETAFSALTVHDKRSKEQGKQTLVTVQLDEISIRQ